MRVDSLPLSSTCSECGKRKYCLVDDLIENRTTPGKRIFILNTSVRVDSHIVYQGDKTKSLLFVKSGSVKSVYTDESGDQQITQFYFAGEYIGLITLKHQVHATAAITLENSIICEITLDPIVNEAVRSQPFLSKIHQRLDAEIRRQYHNQLINNQYPAGKRIGMFLLELVERQKLNHNNTALLRLAMSRADIANYLGLTAATVSRMLSMYNVLGLIAASKKNIRINDINALRKFVA